MVVSKKIIQQTLACLPAVFSQLMIGVGCGWMPPTLVKLRDPNSVMYITADQISWMASVNEIGRFLGPFISPLLIDKAGRKSTLILLTVMYFIIWLLRNFVQSVFFLCITRIIFGLANAINDVVVGIYTTENCSPNFRGIMGSMILFTFFGSLFVEYITAGYLSYKGAALVNTIIAGCAFATLYYGTETPYFLMMKGKLQEAEKSLMWLSGSKSPEEVADELNKIEHSIAEEKLKTQSIKLLFTSEANLKGILVVVSINMLGMTTGAGAFGTYASFIFSPSGTLTTNDFTIFWGAIQFIAVGLTPFIIEKVDRRFLMIGCYAGLTVSNSFSCLLMYLRNNGCNIPYYPWLIFGSISLFSTFGALSSPAGYALKGELLPFSVRAIGVSMAVVGFSISNFAVMKSFLTITEKFGMETNFLIYTVMSLFTTVFLYLVLPETRGKTLHELHNFQKGELVKLEEKPVKKHKNESTFA